MTLEILKLLLLLALPVAFVVAIGRGRRKALAPKENGGGNRRKPATVPETTISERTW
jgi:hypothetical protein